MGESHLQHPLLAITGWALPAARGALTAGNGLESNNPLPKLSAQEPASVSGPGVWRGASGSMPAPYDGERRVRSEGQKGREAFYVYISSLQYSEGKSAQ